MFCCYTVLTKPNHGGRNSCPAILGFQFGLDHAVGSITSHCSGKELGKGTVWERGSGEGLFGKRTRERDCSGKELRKGTVQERSSRKGLVKGTVRERSSRKGLVKGTVPERSSGKGVVGKRSSVKRLLGKGARERDSVRERSSRKGLVGKGPLSSTSRKGTYLTIDTRDQRKSSLIMPLFRSAFHLVVSLASSNCHISIFG